MNKLTFHNMTLYYVKFYLFLVNLGVFFLILYSLLLPNHETNFYGFGKSRRSSVEEILAKQDFQKVYGVDEKLYVYSAYLDLQEDGSYVRVLGGAKSQSYQEVYCQFFDNTLDKTYDVMEGHLETSSSKDTYKYEYSQIFITCELPSPSSRPEFVSITANEARINPLTSKKATVLKVHNPYSETRIAEFAVCVAPMKNIEDPFSLIVWLEYYQMMGVKHFTFYSIAFNEVVRSILDIYGDMISVLPWSNPYTENEEMRLNAQYIQTADCNFRYRGRADYVFILELDEYIVPSHSAIKNFRMLFKIMNKSLDIQISNYSSLVGQYRFQIANLTIANTHHKANSKRWKTPPSILEGILLERMRRLGEDFRAKAHLMSDFKSRSASIPMKVMEPGIDQMEISVEGAAEVQVPEELATIYLVAVPVNVYKHREDDFSTRLVAQLVKRMAELKDVQLSMEDDESFAYLSSVGVGN